MRIQQVLAAAGEVRSSGVILDFDLLTLEQVDALQNLVAAASLPDDPLPFSQGGGWFDKGNRGGVICKIRGFQGIVQPSEFTDGRWDAFIMEASPYPARHWEASLDSKEEAQAECERRLGILVAAFARARG